jgi:CelD/BcsL family acetyltransferase involved in cellulose biosynthesis
MSLNQFRIEVHNQFESCEAEVQQFLERSQNNNPFLTLDWLKLWWNHFGQGKDLYLLLFRQGGQIIGFAPFYRVRRPVLGVSDYYFVGHGISNYFDIASVSGREEEIVNTLFYHFGTQPTSSIAHFHDINDRFSRCYGPLCRKLTGDGFYASVFKLYPCPIACLGNDWDAYFGQQRSKKSRYNLVRSGRRLSQIGSWRFREVTDTSELTHLLPQLERLHAERFSETINPLFSAKRRDFFFSALGQFLGSQMSLSVIELEDTVISFLIGFKMGDVFIDYAPAFDPALESFSPGQIHLMWLMKHKLEEGFKYFDFSKGEAAYKRWWSNDETTNYLFRFGFNLNGAGLLYIQVLDLGARSILFMRTKGYNKQIKGWFGSLRNGMLSACRRSRVQIQEIERSAINPSFPAFDWSYQQIRGLPAQARGAIVDCLVKMGTDRPKIGVDPDRRTAVLVPGNGRTGYWIHY